jgi:anti-anti-sigma factor
VSDVHRVVLTGELTIQTAGERRATLVEALDAAERSAATALELDLAGVNELDTAGLQLLLGAQREAAHLGRPLRLSAMSQAVTDVLAIAHLSAALDDRLALVGAVAGAAADAEETTP